MIDDKKKKNVKKIINGTISEITSAFLSYPINTIKTNSQIGRNISFNFNNNNKINGNLVLKNNNLIQNIKPLFKGAHYSFFNEVINGIVFYSIYEKMKEKTDNHFIQASCGSIGAMLCSHPLYLRRKLSQVGKSAKIGLKINDNYKGIGMCMLNGIPTSAINFGLKEKIAEKLNLGIFSGFLSTSITMILTHPLDTITTCIMTKNKIPYGTLLKFNAFSQRFLEKNLTLGTKLMLLDFLNEKIDKK
jgi:hypothetical protein